MGRPIFIGANMATQLFKDGTSSYFETHRVRHAIEAGWSPDDPNLGEVKHPEVIFPKGMNLEQLSTQEAEAKVLEAMGIKPRAPKVEAVAVVTSNPETREATELPKPKRKYTKRS